MRRIAVLALACAAVCGVGRAASFIELHQTGMVGDPAYSVAGFGFAKAVVNTEGDVYASSVVEDALTIHDLTGGGNGILRMQIHFQLEAPKDEAWVTLIIAGQQIHMQSTGASVDELFDILYVPFTPEQPVSIRLEAYAHASTPGETSLAYGSFSDGILVLRADDNGPYHYTYSTDSGRSYQFDNGQMVPEPASATLAIPALAGLWLLRRKRDRRGAGDGR